MYSSSSLSSATLLRANIRQNIALIFVSEYHSSWDITLLKKYSYIFASFLAFFAFLPTSSYATNTEIKKEFIITAYYSPVEWQSWYSKWSLEAEKRLNGNGIAGANGKPVFMGMIAAPKTYDFGTRIYFEGLGVGIVEDRGWAIVKAWERWQSSDRIDIWMGTGESGLVRARNWGVRKVLWTIITDESKPLLNFKDIDTWKVDLNMYGRVLWGSTYLSEEVMTKFSDLGYESQDNVRSMIIEFQKDHDIIKDENDDGAWVYGPKTRSALAKEHEKLIALKDAELRRIEAEKTLLISARDSWEKKYQTASIKVSSIGSPKRWEKGNHVVELQKTLKSKGYFKGKETGFMNGPTIIAIKTLQRSYGIHQTGIIDSPTQEVLLGMIAESV